MKPTLPSWLHRQHYQRFLNGLSPQEWIMLFHVRSILNQHMDSCESEGIDAKTSIPSDWSLHPATWLPDPVGRFFHVIEHDGPAAWLNLMNEAFPTYLEELRAGGGVFLQLATLMESLQKTPDRLRPRAAVCELTHADVLGYLAPESEHSDSSYAWKPVRPGTLNPDLSAPAREINSIVYIRVDTTQPDNVLQEGIVEVASRHRQAQLIERPSDFRKSNKLNRAMIADMLVYSDILLWQRYISAAFSQSTLAAHALSDSVSGVEERLETLSQYHKELMSTSSFSSLGRRVNGVK